LDLPPLRERPEDIPILVRHFVAHYARTLGRHVEHVAPEVMESLVRHPWPGNVRELQHVIQRAVILSPGPGLQRPPALEPPARAARSARSAPATAETLDDAVREYILGVLRETNGMVAGPRGAAVRLGLKRSTLLSKMQKLGIAPDQVVAPRTGRAGAPVARAIQIRARGAGREPLQSAVLP